MADLRIKAIKEAIDAINKNHPGSVFVLANGPSLDTERIPTGIEELDFIMGDGLPKGRLIQFYGAESAGKTSICMHLLSRVDLAAFIDAEGTLPRDRLPVFGVDEKRLIYDRPSTAEEAFEAAFRFADSGIPLIVLDSIGSLVPASELELDDMEKENSRAVLARFLTRKVPILAAKCQKSGTAMVFINQVRDNMKAMMYGDPYSYPGGHQLRHMLSLVIKVGRKEWLSASGQKLGQTCKCVVTKSKVCDPWREAELSLLFDKGFLINVTPDLLKEELKQARKRALKAGKVIMVDPEDPTPVVDEKQLGKAS